MSADKNDAALSRPQDGDTVSVPRHYGENIGYAAAMLESSASLIDRHNAPALRTLLGYFSATPTAGQGGDDDLRDYVCIAHLIGSIFFYGDFKAETFNERELERLLRKIGRFYQSESEVLAGDPVEPTPAPAAPVSERAREIIADWHRKKGCGQQVIDDCLSGVIAIPTFYMELLEQALTQQRGSPVPEGWRVVPIEPNWDMRNEGREFLIDGLEKEPEKLAYFLWKTMVAAAPEVE